MPFGIPRFFGLLCGGGPAEIRDMSRTLECQTRWIETQQTELNNFDNSAAEGRTTVRSGSMPLVVLSRDPDKGGLPGIIGADVAKQTDMAWDKCRKNSRVFQTRGSHMVAKGAAH